MGIIKLGLLIVLGLIVIGVTEGRRFNRPNPCDSDPCQNDGQCYSGRFFRNGFHCYCKSPYSGEFCDKVCNITVCDNKFQAAKNEFDNSQTSMDKKFFGGYGGYGGVSAKFVEFCLPLAVEYNECLAGVKARGEYCECDEYRIESLNNVQFPKDLCNAGYDYCKTNFPADNACLDLKSSIDTYLREVKNAILLANRPKIDYAARPVYTPHRDYLNGGWGKRKVTQNTRSITRQVAGAEAATGGVTAENIEEKINEYAACAPSVKGDLAAAINVGCFNADYQPNPETEVARLRSELDGCKLYQLTSGCTLPQYYTSPCAKVVAQAPAGNSYQAPNYGDFGGFGGFGFKKRQAVEVEEPYRQEVVEYYTCIETNAAQQPENQCQRYIAGKDAFIADFLANIAELCEVEKKSDSILAVCAPEPEQAPPAEADAGGEVVADVRAMKRILALLSRRR